MRCSSRVGENKRRRTQLNRRARTGREDSAEEEHHRHTIARGAAPLKFRPAEALLWAGAAADAGPATGDGAFIPSSQERAMVKVEAVVIRERIETVIDAVEEQTGHIGVTVVEAVGHGRQRGITHEYRGRVFESRFLPKALLVFVCEDERAGAIVDAIVDAARSGNVSGDGIVWTTPAWNVMHNRTGRSLEEVETR
jgi:nitrogen regulatory protein P-II 1